MSQTKIEITADAQKAEAEYEKLTQAQAKQENAAKQTAATNQQSARQTAAANEAAANKSAASYNRIIAELRKQGPEGQRQAKAVEQYLRETGTAGRRSIGEIVGELETMNPAAAAAAAAVKDNVSAAAETSATKLATLAKELDKLGPEARKQAAAIRGYLHQTGQDGRRSIHEVLNEIGKIDDEAAKVATAATQDFEKVGDAGESAFGAGMRSKLLAMGAAYISLNSAASVYKSTVEAARNAARESVETLTNTTSGNQKLVQISGGDPVEFDRLTNKADELATKYGILREEARQLVFDSKSQGFEPLADFIAQNAGNRVISSEAQTTVAGRVPALFSAEGIGGEEAINAVLTGAAQSILDFEGIARILPTVAASASPTGAGFDESVATLSVLASEFKSGEVASDRIAALAGKFDLDTTAEGRAPLADRGIIEAVRELRDTLTPAQRADFLGESKELNEAYNAIAKNLETIEGRRDEIAASRAATGTDQAATAKALAIMQGRPETVAIREKIAADNREEIAAEKALAVAEAKRQAERAGQRSDDMTRGDNQVAVEARSAFREWSDYVSEGVDAAFEAAEPQFQAIAADATDALSDKQFADPDSQRRLRAIIWGSTQFSARQANAKPGERPQLSSTEAEIFLETLTGNPVNAGDLNAKSISDVTETIRGLGTVSGGRAPFLNSLPISNLLGYNVPRQRALVDAVDNPQLNALIESLRQNNALQRESIELQRETASASRDTANAARDTAENTVPKPPDASAEINAASGRSIPAPI